MNANETSVHKLQLPYTNIFKVKTIDLPHKLGIAHYVQTEQSSIKKIKYLN